MATMIIVGTVKPSQRPAIYLGDHGEKTGKYLNPGDTIQASENNGQWLHLSQINDTDVSTKNWWTTAGATMAYIDWHWQTVSDPEPVGAHPVRTRVELDNGQAWEADNFTRVG